MRRLISFQKIKKVTVQVKRSDQIRNQLRNSNAQQKKLEIHGFSYWCVRTNQINEKRKREN